MAYLDLQHGIHHPQAEYTRALLVVAPSLQA